MSITAKIEAALAGARSSMAEIRRQFAALESTLSVEQLTELVADLRERAACGEGEIRTEERAENYAVIFPFLPQMLQDAEAYLARRTAPKRPQMLGYDTTKADEDEN